MSDLPSFSIPGPANADETTDKFVITFREDSIPEGLASLKKHAGIAKLPNAAEFEESALDLKQADDAGGAVFPTLGVAVVTLDQDSLAAMTAIQGEDSPILSIEPERIFYALGDGTLPLAYLRGYRDAVDHLCERAADGTAAEDAEAAVTYVDDAQSTWGLKATRVVNSRFTGRGIKVAVLDTGFVLQHPDFRGRSITSKSFYPGETVQDRLGHGTATTRSAARAWPRRMWPESRRCGPTRFVPAAGNCGSS